MSDNTLRELAATLEARKQADPDSPFAILASLKNKT